VDQEGVGFLLQHCSDAIFQRHGSMSLHVVLREIQIVESSRFQMSIGTLELQHLLKVLEHLTALDAGTLSALNSDNLLPIQVAVARRFPEEVTFLLVRSNPDSLTHLS